MLNAMRKRITIENILFAIAVMIVGGLLMSQLVELGYRAVDHHLSQQERYADQMAPPHIRAAIERETGHVD